MVTENFDKVYKAFARKDYFHTQDRIKTQLGNWKRAIEKGDEGAKKYTEKDIISQMEKVSEMEARIGYEKLKKAIEKKDVDFLKSILRHDQKFSQAAFVDITGKRLPKTTKEIQSFLDDMFKNESVNEGASSKDVLYVDANSGGHILWISYSPGSGTTHPLKDYKSAWLTDKKSRLDPSGEHYSKYIVNDIVQWSKRTKAVLKNKISRLHKVPVYSGIGSREQRDMSIWGGDIKPKGSIYILIAQETDGSHVVSFFKTFNEAKNWLVQQSNG